MLRTAVINSHMYDVSKLKSFALLVLSIFHIMGKLATLHNNVAKITKYSNTLFPSVNANFFSAGLYIEHDLDYARF